MEETLVAQRPANRSVFTRDPFRPEKAVYFLTLMDRGESLFSLATPRSVGPMFSMLFWVNIRKLKGIQEEPFFGFPVTRSEYEELEQDSKNFGMNLDQYLIACLGENFGKIGLVTINADVIS